MMLVLVMRHFMQYYTVGPFLFEYDEERLQGNIIVERAIAENILPKTLDCNAGAMQALIFSQYFTLAGSTTLAIRSMVSRISSRSHFSIFRVSKSVKSW